MTRVPLTVVIPTIGRPRALAACLTSVSAGSVQPSEVIVVDQSADSATARVLADYPLARSVRLAEQNVAAARNAGLRAAAHDAVLMTDDDCTVDRSWVSTGWLLLNHHGWRLATGRVLDGDGGQATPSTTTRDAPLVYEDSRHCDVLFTGNAAMDRRAVLELGGFDEQFASAAEDNDLCYRWLQAGHALRYEPAMTVTHHGRREPGDLQALYVRYWRGQGRFYGKLVRRRDANVLRFLARDGRDLMRAYAAGLLRPTPGRLDPRRAMVRGLPPGIVEGWRSRRRGQG